MSEEPRSIADLKRAGSTSKETADGPNLAISESQKQYMNKTLMEIREVMDNDVKNF